MVFFGLGFEDQKIAAFGSSYNLIECIREGLVGWQGAFAGKPAPTNLTEYSRKKWVGCQAAFAGKPRSYKLIECIREGLVGWQGAFAGKPAPTILTEGIREGLVGCWGAFAGKPRSYSLAGYIRERLVVCQDGFAGKPRSYRSSPAHTAPLLTTQGRALARLPLILLYPPLREAEWRCSSGGGRVAPCGEAAHIERRSKRSRP
ncbi:hypothetical protein AL066_03280 [Pseudomonas nunensis]|nr:hypothetical protein AL066_03280 [Pseudomonas nunensis]